LAFKLVGGRLMLFEPISVTQGIVRKDVEENTPYLPKRPSDPMMCQKTAKRACEFSRSFAIENLRTNPPYLQRCRSVQLQRSGMKD
jgi:hypothetical protein